MRDHSVTVVGLGVMGHALATMLVNNGWKVTLWNRSPGKGSALVAQGAVFEPDLSRAIARAPVAVISLSDHAATISALDRPGVGEAVAGRALIQLSTVTSTEAEAFEAWARKRGAECVIGQIMAYADEVLDSRGKILCSGDTSVLSRHEAVLVAAGSLVIHVGTKIGAAATFDKACLSAAFGFYLSFLHGAAMVKAAGIDPRQWCDFALGHYASGAPGEQLAVLADQLCSRDYDEGLDASVDVWRVAAEKTVVECDALIPQRAHLEPLVQMLEMAGQKGFGRKELGVLYEMMMAPGE